MNDMPYDIILIDPVSPKMDHRRLPNLGLAAIDGYLNSHDYRSVVVDLTDLSQYRFNFQKNVHDRVMRFYR